MATEQAGQLAAGKTMGTPSNQTKRFEGQEILRDLIPLNALTDERFREISNSLTIEDISAGNYLFGEGDLDNRSIYLLDGVINFIDASGKVTGVVAAGTDPARYPIANQQPRLITARAATKAVIASIDSTLLDVMLTIDQSAGIGIPTVSTDAGEDWMTRVLQSDAFIKLPPSDIQRLLQTLQPRPVSAGDVIIRQGDEGDYFYIIREGSCSVTRLASGKGWDVPLAELCKGDCFGEEALVSDAIRNATVTMITDGTLMRLSKKDFVELLKKPLVHSIDYELATAAVAGGDVWLDVRLKDEHENYAFDESVNIPLASIRDKAAMLSPGKKYILYCDTGRRSVAAAFLLSQRGFEVYVLEGGLNKGVPAGVFKLTASLPDSGASTDSHSPGQSPAVATTTESAGDTDNTTDKDNKIMSLQPITGLHQHSLSGLQAEWASYLDITKRLDAVIEEERHAREALTEHIGSLLTPFSDDTTG